MIFMYFKFTKLFLTLLSQWNLCKIHCHTEQQRLCSPDRSDNSQSSGNLEYNLYFFTKLQIACD
jgi:hypothetical protein